MTDDGPEQTSSSAGGNPSGAGWIPTVLICLLILLAGGGIVAFVFYSQPETTRGDGPDDRAVLVETTSVDTGTFRPKIEAMGTVKPVEDVVLRPRVSGEIMERDEHFTPGGYVQQGDTLVQIDPRDHRNTLAQRRSELEQARSELEIEQGQQEVAREEFELLGEEIPEEDRDLVLRRPQLATARAEVRSAEAAVEQAELDLERTSIEAPFDAHVLSRNVSVGSQVSQGDDLGRIVALDRFWVDATVPVSDLRWLSIPESPDEQGARVRIENESAWNPEEFRVGRISELIGELNEETRMARVRVVVTDPMAYDIDDMNSPPLLIGSYVQTVMDGIPISNAARLDREYVREGDTVWVMEDGQLEIRSVDVVFRDRNHAFIRNGLSAGDQVVTSSLSTVTEGMDLRRSEEAPSPENDSSADTGASYSLTPDSSSPGGS